MKKNVLLEKIGIGLLSLIIIIFSLIIGANGKGLRVIPITILLLLIIIFLVCKKTNYKNESIFFKNKIDILVFIFIISTFLPLIFKTYSSLSYQIEFMIKYVFYYAVYILARNTIKTKEHINTIYSVIIFSSIIPIMLGIGSISGNNTFKWIIQKLNLGYQMEYKPTYTFGYANTVAVYLSMCIFLSLYKIFSTKDRQVKITYLIYIVLALYNIYLCYSRMPSILLIIFLLIFFINKYKTTRKNNLKKTIIITSIIVILIIILLSFILKISKPFSTNQKIYEREIIYKFKKGKEYNIKLDLDLYNENKPYNAFTVRMVAVNKYYNEKNINLTDYNVGHNIVNVKFIPENNTDIVKFYIYNNNTDGIIKFNKSYINNKEYILHYKYLPQRISKFICQLSKKDKSIVERYYYYKDSINIFKRHIIFGNGGNAWRSLSKVNQEYAFSVKETHSYFFELLIEYGLVGIITYFIMLISIIKYLISNKKEEKKILLYVLGILLIHSITFDFNMSFMLIQIITYTLFACILSNDKKKKIIKTKYDYIPFAVLIVTLFSTTYMCLYKYNIINKKYYLPINRSIIENRLEKIEYEESSPKEKLSILISITKEEPYLNQTEVFKKYMTILLESEKNISNREFGEYLDYILNHVDKTEVYAPYYINTLIEREETLHTTIEILENSSYKDKEKHINKLKKIIKNDYIKYIGYIKDSEKNGYNIPYVNKAINIYKKMYEEVK